MLVYIFSITLCILMDFPIHIVTICMGLPIVYFKGVQVEFSKLIIIMIIDFISRG